MTLLNSQPLDRPFDLGKDALPPAAVWVIVSIAAFVTAALVWASLAPLEELSRAEGRIIPSGRTQIVQSAEAGVVTEILVRTGQQVEQGALLVRLDDTSTTSSAGEVQSRVMALEAQTTRLRIEYGGGANAPFVCPASLQTSAPELCENEAQLLASRAQSLIQNKGVLQERVEQRQRELAEAQANAQRIAQTLELSQQNHDLMAPLADQGLVARSTFISAQRELSELSGQRAANAELVARLQSALHESDLQLEQAETMFRQEALAELTSKLAELASLREQLRGATDRVSRTDIRAPVSGIVNSLEVNTIGAVVQPGSRILDIVPATDTLLVEARLNPADVAFIIPGQDANIKLTAYDFSIFGGLKGVVQNVSADSIVDPDTRETYYSVLIAVDQPGLAYRGETLPILPGMVTNVEIITGQKTVLQYLLKPITKAREEALRER